MITECPFCGYDALEYQGIDDDAGDYAGQAADVYECLNCGAMVTYEYPVYDAGSQFVNEGLDHLDLELRYQDEQRSMSDDETGYDFPF